ncbi:MAG TPA: hypothetical protein VMM18_07125 [Gemmatimonadaceae bacterium]|nr:hypothetical protein [Gemmatimonadaceae bacterium]
MTVRVAGPTAALAGVPFGVQAQGAWIGRPQLFVRFAAEAETATMYTARALAQELARLTTRATVHSVCCGGRDALGNAEFLRAAFEEWEPTVPVMVDTDGQRPDALETVRKHVTLFQVTLDCNVTEAAAERAMETLRSAAAAGREHALVVCPAEDTSDAQILRIVEQAHAASAGTIIVVHPIPGPDVRTLDRRWAAVLEGAMTLHRDVRLALRLPPPVGLR